MSETMIIALFDRFAHAQNALDDLVNAGIRPDRITLLANNTDADHPPPLSNPSLAAPQDETSTDATADMGIGIGTGMAVGAGLGALLELSYLTLPGIGALIAAGPWVPVFLAAGGIIGGAIAVLSEHKSPPEDAELYAEGLRRGGTLLSLGATDAEIHKISDILGKHGAVDIEERDRHWRAEGWVGFDRDAQPLSVEAIAHLREKLPEATDEPHRRRPVRHYFTPAPEHLAGVSPVTTHYAEDVLKG